MRCLTRWLHAIHPHLRRANVVGLALSGALLLTLALWKWGPILSAPLAPVAQAAVSAGSADVAFPDKKPTPKPRPPHPTPPLTPTPADGSGPPALPTPADIPSSTALPTMTAPTPMPTTLPTVAASSIASSGVRTGETGGSGNGSAPPASASLLAALGWGLGAMVVGMLGFSLTVFATRPEKGKRIWGRHRRSLDH